MSPTCAPKRPDRIKWRLRWQVPFHQNPHKNTNPQNKSVSAHCFEYVRRRGRRCLLSASRYSWNPQTREKLLLWDYLPFGLIRPRFLVLSANCRALQTKLMVPANFCGIVAGIGEQPIMSYKRMGTRSSRFKKLSGKNRCWMLGPVI